MTLAAPSEDALIALLRERGAAELPHARGRPLLAHLVETAAILRRWRQPAELQLAALLHSVYGTDSYRHQLLAPAERSVVAGLAGGRAERLAHLFSIIPRRALLAGTHRWAPELLTAPDANEPSATRDELDALVLIHMANLAEQAGGRDGTPGPWLARLGELAGLIADSQAVTLPSVLAALIHLSAEDEALARRAYREGLAQTEPAARASRLALAAAACPVVPEPCAWLAGAAWRDGDEATARAWAAQAQQRLRVLGTPWDKRLSYEEWECAIAALQTHAPRPLGADPRVLLGAARTPTRAKPSRARFDRYVENLGADYPDLAARPWHDPAGFPLVRALEAHAPAIQAEILALDPSRFQRESERIGRAGDWDVAFFYERGRRHDETCSACPVTTRVIEAPDTVRTAAGLIYASRMRAGTHIAAHRGPTNLRLRCHLAIKVPPGDCAIRVGDETRGWEPGRCLVFDDRFEHEAWNHTGEDRIVLIVDLWHPDLSEEEIRLLEGLQSHTDAQARRLARYWAANARARGG